MLTSRFETLRMEEDEQFIDFHTRLQDIVNSMRGLGEEIKNPKIIRKILRLLPERFHSKVTVIEECQDLDKMKLEELIGSLQTFELQFRSPIKKKSVALKIDEDFSPENYSKEGMALFAHRFKKMMRFNARNLRKKAPPNKQNLNQNPRRPVFPKEEPVYYECKGHGHFASECANKRKKIGQGKAMVAT